jgi:nucleotide-binding universal stress UspA family protein
LVRPQEQVCADTPKPPGKPFAFRWNMIAKRILVPVDFSDPSRQALDYAIELARGSKTELVVLHVVEPAYYPGAADISGMGYDAAWLSAELERLARQQLVELDAELRKRRVRARTLLRLGNAHQVIAQTAKKARADLIVMSTHGRSGLSHVLIGSVAERVVRIAPCPVLTVRAQLRATRRRATRLVRPRTRTTTPKRARQRR